MMTDSLPDVFSVRCHPCGVFSTYPTHAEAREAALAHECRYAGDRPEAYATAYLGPGYIEPDDQVLSAPVWCFHPSRARINPNAPWFCVTCGEQARVGEDDAIEEFAGTVGDLDSPLTAEMVRASTEPGGETPGGDGGAPLEAPRVAGAKKEDKRDSFLDFLFGGRA